MHWRPRIEVLVGRCSVDNHGSAAMTRMSESLRQTTENLVQISAYLIERSILLFRGVRSMRCRNSEVLFNAVIEETGTKQRVRLPSIRSHVLSETKPCPDVSIVPQHGSVKDSLILQSPATL